MCCSRCLYLFSRFTINTKSITDIINKSAITAAMKTESKSACACHIKQVQTVNKSDSVHMHSPLYSHDTVLGVTESAAVIVNCN